MASLKVFEQKLNSIVNVFSKTKRTTVRMSKDVPTAAFDIVNDVFVYNEDFVTTTLYDYAKYRTGLDYYNSTEEIVLAYFLAGHELGHQYFTNVDQSKLIDPQELTRFVINIVEDSYIEHAWKAKHFSYSLEEFTSAMTMFREYSVQDHHCAEVDAEDVSIKSALFYLLYSSYHKTYPWSKEFLPKELVTYFKEIITMMDDVERFEHTIEFTKLLMEHFKDEQQQQEQQQQDGNASVGDGDEQVMKQIKEFLDQLDDKFNHELKEVQKGNLSPLDLIEQYSEDKINFFQPSDHRETQRYKSLMTSMANLFNKYRFRVKNDMSFNEKHGEIDMKNIPFSNIRTDFFMQTNEYKRDFDFEFVVAADFSGSMGSVHHEVSDITAAFTNACIASKIPITVYGFDHSTYLLVDKRNKSLQHNYNMIKSSYSEMGGSTDLLPAINNGLKQLKMSTHKDKIFIIITDGDTYNIRTITELVKQKHMGIHFVGISIEQGEYLFELLKDHKVLHYDDASQINRLPNDLIGHIYDTYMKGENI